MYNTCFNKNNGITLIALVVTIIVLLILAGISIAMLTGENGILTKAIESKEQTKIVQAKEKIELSAMTAASENKGNLTADNLKKELENNGINVPDFTEFPVTIKDDGGNFVVDKDGTVTIVPDELEIGSTVEYVSSGTYSNWKSEYSGNESTEDTVLDAKDGIFKIDTWRVLDIGNGNITLVPSEPSNGRVYLGSEQGYNNGVKLLNDACSSLYGNASNGITARSICIEDIENYMLKDKLLEVHQYVDSNSDSAKYGEQKDKAYTGNNKNYPAIYSKEKLSVINEIKNLKGWGKSEQTEFIEKTTDGATNGKVTSAESIHPYQSYWKKDESYMQEAFKTASNGVNYKDLLIIPDRAYWLASRCISTEEYGCGFYMSCVYNGSITADWKCGSENSTYGSEMKMFPIVTVKAELVKLDKKNGFTVKLN